MTPLLELDDLACSRGPRRLFERLTLGVPAGSVLHVQGGNGAGKTSLLRMVCGLAAPTQGQVRWRGRPVAAQRDEFHRDLVYLGHAAALKDDLSALENLRSACRLGGHRVGAADALAALDAAGLRGREDLPARVLSQGQRRRVALARLALGLPCALWVLDEPFNALDTAAIGWLLGLIGAQVARGGLVVLTSHQPVALASGQRRVELRL